MTTVPIEAGSTSVRSRSSRTQTFARSTAVRSRNTVPERANGVRHPATIATLRLLMGFLSPGTVDPRPVAGSREADAKMLAHRPRDATPFGRAMTPRHRCHAARSRLPAPPRSRACARSRRHAATDALDSRPQRPVEGRPSSLFRPGRCAVEATAHEGGAIAQPHEAARADRPAQPHHRRDRRRERPSPRLRRHRERVRRGRLRLDGRRPRARRARSACGSASPSPRRSTRRPRSSCGATRARTARDAGCTATACGGRTPPRPACGACASSRSASRASGAPPPGARAPSRGPC